MRMKLSDAAQALGIEAAPAWQDLMFDGLGTDTRESLQGQLFVALRGERFDAHAYLELARDLGAVAAVIEDRPDLAIPAGLPVLRVADTRKALGLIAAAWRARFVLPVIGITGSNGKTTVKEMCAAILRAWLGNDAVLATTGNLNNDIGVPKMLARLDAGHRAAVIEMGMNHPGEIAWLAGLVCPTVALVNNAQRAHLEGMGGLEAVAAEKGDLFRALGADGVAVINADDPHAAFWAERQQGGRCVRFGLDAAAEVRASVEMIAGGSRLHLDTPAGKADFVLPVLGIHNARNALGAMAACMAAGAPLEACVRGLQGFTGAKGRLQRKVARGGALLLDDTYNANPDSAQAGIDVLAACPGRQFLVLGDMGEIGDRSAQYHDEIGGYAKSAGIDRLFALGEHSVLAAKNFGEGGAHFESVEALAAAVLPLLEADVVVLVKGSRFMRMERVVEALCPPPDKD